MLATLDRLLTLYTRTPDDWQALVRRGMRQDFSWRRAADRYLDLYRSIVA
jgi:glycogen synthase